MKHHCQMDLRNFPLDKQNCDFKISTCKFVFWYFPIPIGDSVGCNTH